MNIGIDFGAYKTVVGSSSSNGSIVFDELSFRTIKTLAELTVPRKFGNHVGEPMYMTIEKRYREFTESFNTAHFSFLKYLVCLGCGCINVTATVPYYADAYDREKIGEFFQLMGIRAHLMTDIVAAGFLYGIKHEEAQQLEKFALIDFGHTKTTFGVFQRENNSIKTLFIKGIKIGARDFDERLLNFLLTKYKHDDKIIEEKLRMKLERVKSNLNDITECKFTINLKGDSLNFDLTKEEYRICIEDVLAEFDVFFKEIKSDWDLPVQAIGGNRFNFFIKELLHEWNLKIEMNAAESVAIGAALSGAICRFGSKMALSLYDVVPSDIYLQTGENESKQSIAIKSGTNIPTPQYKITLNKKDKLHFVTNNKIMKTFLIDSSNVSGSIDLKFQINSLGRLTTEVADAAVKESQIFTFENVLEEEQKMVEAENAIIRVGEMRNELESALSLIPTEGLTEEQIELITDAKRTVLFASMSDTIENEIVFRDGIYKKIEFIENLVENLVSGAKLTIDAKVNEGEVFIKENNDIFVPSVYKLQGLIYRAKQVLTGINCDVFGLIKFREQKVDSLVMEFDNLMNQAIEEMKRKREEERIKKEEKEKKDDRKDEKKDETENKDEITDESANEEVETKDVEDNNNNSENIEEGEKTKEEKKSSRNKRTHG